MNIRVWGPLLFTAMLFVIAAAIKLAAFSNTTFFIDLPTELALWATGVMFSLAVSEQMILKGRAEAVFRRKETGTGIEIEYRAIAPESLDFSPRTFLNSPSRTSQLFM